MLTTTITATALTQKNETLESECPIEDSPIMAVQTYEPQAWEAEGDTPSARRLEHIKAFANGKTKLFIRFIAPKKFGVEEAKEQYPELIFTRKKAKADGSLSQGLKTFQGILDLNTGYYQQVSGSGEKKGTPIKDGIKYIDTKIPNIYGSYAVVNRGTGFNDKEITKGESLFFEFDHISIEDQWKKIHEVSKSIGRPSVVVKTAKSLHSYWNIEGGVEDIAQWRLMQERFLDWVGSDDKSIKNPSRIMRLPGKNHVAYNKESGDFVKTMVRVVEKNDVSVSIDRFNELLPESDREKQERARGEKIERAVAAQGVSFSYNLYDNRVATSEEIRRAVTYLPVRVVGQGTYENCRNALWGLCATVGVDDAIALYETVSPSGGGWDIPAIASAYVPGKISSGCFWWFARAGGYRDIVRQRVKIDVEKSIKLRAVREAQFEHLKIADGEEGVYAKATALNRRIILDKRLTGAGKSHMLEEVKSPLLYVSNTPYNPSTQHLYSLAKLPARHAGRYEHKTKKNAAGEPLTESKDNGGMFKPGNCIKAEEVNLASSAGVDMQACSKCVKKLACMNGDTVIMGGEPGYLSQIAKIKNQPQIRLHPQSLPKIKSEAEVSYYGDRVLFFDDVSLTIPVTKQVSAKAIASFWLKVKDADLQQNVKDFFQHLYETSEEAKKTENKWGIPSVLCQPSKTLQQIADDVELTILLNIEAKELEVDFEGKEFLDYDEKKLLVAEDWARVREADDRRKEALIKAYSEDGMAAIVSPLLYNPDAVISFDGDGNLKIAWQDKNISAALGAAKQVWISDATLDVEAFLLAHGIEHKDVLIIETAERDNKNIDLVFATGFGSLTRYTDESQVNDIVMAVLSRAAVLGEGQVGFIVNYESIGQDALSALHNLGVVTGQPHSDSRGSNAFVECKEIYIGSSLIQNKGSVSDEFALIYKQLVHPGSRENPMWVDFCWSKQASEAIQAIGRGRHSRRVEEHIKIFFMGQMPDTVVDLIMTAMPGAKFCHEFRVDFEGVTFREHEENKLKLFDAFIEVKEEGYEEVSWRILEERSGVNKSTIRSILTEGGRSASEKKQEIYDQIDSGLCYLPSQKLGLIAPVAFLNRNTHRVDKIPTEREVEKIVDATIAYGDRKDINLELSIDVLPLVDPEYWGTAQNSYQPSRELDMWELAAHEEYMEEERLARQPWYDDPSA